MLLAVAAIWEDTIPSRECSIWNPCSFAELSTQVRLIHEEESAVADRPLGADGCAELGQTLPKDTASVNQVKRRTALRKSAKPPVQMNIFLFSSAARKFNRQLSVAIEASLQEPG
jgi:hypothetical protein